MQTPAVYVIQIQCCNVIHIICGAIAFALAFVQFSSIGLDNTNIDFRLLNFVHVVTGAVGVFMVRRATGSIAAKSMYYVSLTLGLFTVGFYAESLVETNGQYQEYRKLILIASTSSDANEKTTFDELAAAQMGKLIICSVMVALSAIEAVVSLGSIALLDLLAGESAVASAKSVRRLQNRSRLAFVGVLKIFFGCVTVALSAYLEHMQKRTDRYITIAMDILAGAFTLISGMIDLLTLYSRRHHVLNLKVSFVFTTLSAVLSLKALDYLTTTYFRRHLHDYTDGDDAQLPAERRDKFIQFVVDAAILGCLAILFFMSIISAMIIGSYMDGEVDGFTAEPVGTLVRKQRTVLGTVQFFAGFCLIVLTILSFIPNWPAVKAYAGANVLWTGVLFVAAGVVCSSKLRTLSNASFAFGVISLMVASKYLAFSLNLVYEAVSNRPPLLLTLANSDGTSTESATQLEQRFAGRIALYAAQSTLFFIELIASLITVVIFAAQIAQFDTAPAPIDNSPSTSTTASSTTALLHGRRGLNCALVVLAVGHLLYACVTVGVSIAVEIAVYQFAFYDSMPAFIRLMNGIIVFGVAVVQFQAVRRPAFLAVSSILQIVSAAIAFFVIPPVVASLYRQVFTYRSELETTLAALNGRAMPPELEARNRLMIAFIGVNAAELFLACFEFVVSVISAMVSSYLVHHIFRSAPSSSVGAEQRFSTLQYLYAGRLPAEMSERFRRSDASANDKRARNGGARYFGDDFRTYTSRMLQPPLSVYYPTDRASNSSQTNIRHIFHSSIPSAAYVSTAYSTR